MIKSIIIVAMLFAPILNANCQVMFGQVDHRKVLKFNSNYFTFSKPHEIIIFGKKQRLSGGPITINGRIIYNDNVETPAFKLARFKGDFSRYLLEQIKEDLELLPDGAYSLNRFFMVVDKFGDLAYFDFDTLIATTADYKMFNAKFIADGEKPMSSIQEFIDQLSLRNTPTKTKKITEPYVSREIKLRIYKSAYKAMVSCPKFKPATVNGKPVDLLLDPMVFGFHDIFVVRNGKASLLKMENIKALR